MGAGLTAFGGLVVWDVFHRDTHLEVLIGLLFIAAAAVSAIFVLMDNWANRYDQAFEVGYRLRDLDDLAAPVPEPRRLHVVELPSEERQPS